jgi:hypothetical protein
VCDVELVDGESMCGVGSENGGVTCGVKPCMD